MSAEKTAKACAICTKRHEITHGRLECRARPPAQDVALHARFPVVKPADYCHSDFVRDAAAAEAWDATLAETGRLDGLVAATQERAALDLVASDRPAEPAAPQPKRARRARPDAAQKTLL